MQIRDMRSAASRSFQAVMFYNRSHQTEKAHCVHIDRAHCVKLSFRCTKGVHRFLRVVSSCFLLYYYLLFTHITIRPPALKATSNSSGSKSQSDDEPTQKAVADRFSMWEKRAGDSLTPLRQATPLNRAASANRPAFKGLCRRI